MEVLRDCLPSSVGQTLKDLPESLDETYEGILKEIKRPNRKHALRVLQCLVVAIRPLRVTELAEVLAVDFNDTEGPKLKTDWRWEQQEFALLSACSSLIAIVQAGDSRVVQFSHFSVKEYLTSPRFAAKSGEVSNYYYIGLEPAHTILAQTCLGVLLQTQDDGEGHIPRDHPLVRYAAEHWTTHAQLGELSSCLYKGMECLFDADKPHFNVWRTLFDIDTRPKINATFHWFAPNGKSPASPLYYAALCGFQNLVKHLIIKNPKDVNVNGGYYVRPLVAALAGEHFQTADLLHHNDADLHVQGGFGMTPLHAAAFSGNLKVVRILIKYHPADINARDEDGSTPLVWASIGHNFKDGSVLRFLLQHGADINMRDPFGGTPLFMASISGALEVVRLLLERGADVDARRNDGKTAMQVAAKGGHDEVVRLLREHGDK